MSQYKQYRRSQNAAQKISDSSSIDPKYRGGVAKLHELFPDWSEQDLQSVLQEVGNDVETAVMRISEGHAEQWGNVSRKKDKKPVSTPSTHSPASSSIPSGGARGGRGGRGRGGFSSRGGRGGGRTPTPRVQRDAGASSASAAEAANGGNTWDATPKDSAGWADGTATTGGDDWGADPAPASAPTPALAVEEAKLAAADADSWAAQHTPPTMVNGINKPKISKTPASTGGKLSWAQIAKPQPKPQPAPTPAEPAPELSESEPVAALQGQEVPAEEYKIGWEEPTTAQPPIWDEGPAKVATPEPPSHLPDDDGWIKGKEDSFKGDEILDMKATPQPDAFQSPNVDQSTPDLTSTSDLSSAIPSSTVSPTPPPAGKPATPKISNAARRFKADQAVVMPSFGVVGGGLGSVGMQFGSLSISGDADGLPDPPASKEEQAATAVIPEQGTTAPPFPVHTQVSAPMISVPQPSPKGPITTEISSYISAQPSPARPPPGLPSQPSQPEVISPPPPPQQSISPSGMGPPGVPAPPPLAALAASSHSTFQSSPPPSLNYAGAQQQTSQQQTSTTFSSTFQPLGPPQQPQQPSQLPSASQQSIPITQSQQQQQYQQGLPTHVDSPALHQQLQLQQQQLQSQQQPSAQSQAQNLGGFGRQQDYGFSQPSQTQTILSQHSGGQQQPSAQEPLGYSNTFSNLNHNQGQFNPNQEYEQRGFYEGNYSQPGQQTSFSARDFLGQDFNKLPAPQNTQAHQTSSISPAGGQPGQSLSSQSHTPTSQAPGGAQNQQGFAPPPVPYYSHNPYYGQPNPYYGGPYPGYGMNQPFMNMKYPLYPGPPAPAPGTPASAGGKGGLTQNVPPPTHNSYGSHSGLYGSQYDDGNYPTHQAHHQAQHHPSASGGSSEFGKPSGLYGLSHSQGFLNQSAQSLNRHSQSHQPHGNSTPDSSFKNYAAQNVSSVGAGKSGETTGRVPQLYGSGAGSGAASRFNTQGLASVNTTQHGQGGNFPPSSGETNFYSQFQRPQYWQ